MRWISLLSFVVFAVGCSSPAPGKVCTPGKSEACTGPGGCAGGQQCNDDGTGFGACDCGAAVGGAGGGTGGPGGGTGGGSGGGSGGGAGGGGGNVGDGGSTDGGADGGTACDPLAPAGAQGCATGQKCTWVIVSDSPQEFGRLACVPDGTVSFDQMCARGPAGETTGYDNCVAGYICAGSTCKDICGFDNSANAACGSGDNCTRFSGLFANGVEDAVAGACTPGCNPLLQTRSDGGTCGAGQGCYLLTSSTTTVSVCAGAGTVQHNQAITGTVYGNSCVPGAISRKRYGTTVFECGSLCAPSDVYSGNNVANESGVAPQDCQTRTASATSPAQPPADVMNGESCRYFWSREPFTTRSPFSNTLGYCFKHAAAMYDSNGDAVDDAPFPRCVTLTTGDVVPPIGNPPHNDAQYFWCVAAPVSLLPVKMPKDLEPELPPNMDRVRDWTR